MPSSQQSSIHIDDVFFYSIHIDDVFLLIYSIVNLTYLLSFLLQSSSSLSKNDILLEESRRMESIAEAHRDLLRADQLLIKHIQEMDDFEAQSKLDRVKALSGMN